MVALNSGETRGDHQDVSGLGEEVVMEDISHVEPALQEIMASLSSTPSHDVSGDTLLPVPEPAEPHLPPEPAPASSSSRVVGPRVHQSPVEILEELLPSRDFSLLLDENAWRFRVECKVKGQVFEPPYQNKTFSKAFKNGGPVTWQAALKECHKYLWEKWALVKKKALMLSRDVQEPYHVSQEFLVDLKVKKMDSLSGKKTYSSSSNK